MAEKKNITILVDVDDVLTNHVKAWCAWLNNKHGTNVSEKDVTDLEIQQFFPSLTADEVFEPLHNDEFWDTVDPKEGAQKYLKMLIDEGYDIKLCTASNFDTIKSKFDKLISRYFPFISWSDVIVIKRKQMVLADILVDDAVHNLYGGRYMKILFTSQSNATYNATANGMCRADSWEDVYKIVHEYEKRALFKKYGLKEE